MGDAIIRNIVRCLVCGVPADDLLLLRDGRLWATCPPCSQTTYVNEQTRGFIRSMSLSMVREEASHAP
jgi:uncharacterized metal-binding protein